MSQFKKVLCPVDFDENSKRALRSASKMMQERKGELILLHIVAKPAAPWVALPLAQLDATGTARRLEELARVELPMGSHYEIQLRKGDPAKQILAAARKIDADLIVMATHGRKGLRRMVLGSVAEAVVREAPCPVLMIRLPNRTRKPRFPEVKARLLDGSTSL